MGAVNSGYIHVDMTGRSSMMCLPPTTEMLLEAEKKRTGSLRVQLATFTAERADLLRRLADSEKAHNELWDDYTALRDLAKELLVETRNLFDLTMAYDNLLFDEHADNGARTVLSNGEGIMVALLAEKGGEVRDATENIAIRLDEMIDEDEEDE